MEVDINFFTKLNPGISNASSLAKWNIYVKLSTSCQKYPKFEYENFFSNLNLP